MNSIPPSSKWPVSAVLTLLLAFVGPPTALVVVAYAINPSPWLAISFVLLYWALALLVSCLTKIWQKLEASWIEAIANKIDQAVRSAFSRYHYHYRQYFTWKHRDLNTKGMGTQGAFTLALEHVFVPLAVNPTPPHVVSSDLVPPPPALSTARHSIWEFLIKPSLREQQFVLLGAPGSGKTTLLQHLGLLLIQRRQPRGIKKLPQKLPILLFLREHSQAISENAEYSLVDAIHASVHRWGQEHPMPRGWIEHRLDRGQCLLLLDGLDEVADAAQRKQIVAWIEQQMGNYHRNRFVLTSRPFGYRDNPLAGVTTLAVQPFSFQQTTKFVLSWYYTNEIKKASYDDRGVRMTAEKEARDLLRRLREASALHDLTVNPLLLTMIATIHENRGMLPGARVDLYKEICEVFLGKRQEARGLQQDLRAEQRQLVLQPLAYNMMIQGIRDIANQQAEQVIATPLQQVSVSLSPHAFLDDMHNRGGLLLERAQGIYSFAHKTFQEYLAAVHIKEKGLEQILLERVQDGWWHETIRLYYAQADAASLIEVCLQAATVETLTLALECEHEALSVHPETQQRLRLQEAVDQGIEDADPERRHITAGALLTRRLRQMYSINDQLFINTSLITHAEYQLFLDEQREQRRTYYQPDHWISVQFPTGQGKSPILGIRRSDAQAFCDWLSLREGGIWSYRLPRKEDFRSIDQSIWKDLSQETGYWTADEQRFNWSQGQPSSDLHNLIQEARIRVREDALARAGARAREVNGGYALAHERARAGIHTLALALAGDLELNMAIDLDLALEHALELDRDRVLDHSPGIAPDLAHTLDFDHMHVADHPHTLEHSRALNIDLVLDRNRELTRALALDLYLQLLMLLERRAGRLPAYEGILLVKEMQGEKL